MPPDIGIVMSWFAKPTDTDMRLNPVLAAAVIQFSSLVFSQIICDDKLYGNINLGECSVTHGLLPGGRSPPAPWIDAPRIFAEPQFLQPPFTGLANPYGTKMVQLPKIWRSCQ